MPEWVLDGNFSTGVQVKIGTVVLGQEWSEGSELYPTGEANPVQIQYNKRFAIVREECIPRAKTVCGQWFGLWEVTMTIETMTKKTHQELKNLLDFTGAGPYLVETDGLGQTQMVIEEASFSQKGGESSTAFYWQIKLIEYVP